jgi:hypothetical protein
MSATCSPGQAAEAAIGEAVVIAQRLGCQPLLDRADTIQAARLRTAASTIQHLVTYWGTGYDWRKCEAKLNALPQFTTEIDGLDIHFIHATSRHEDALPLIITHGWPGSVIELLEVAGPLTDPAAHGTAAPPRTRPILSSRRCPAAGSPASRRRSAGIPAVPRGPGRS